MNFIIGSKKKAAVKQVKYVGVLCRYAYENDKAVKLITMDNGEHYVPFCYIENYIPKSGTRNLVETFYIEEETAKRKGMVNGKVS